MSLGEPGQALACVWLQEAKRHGGESNSISLAMRAQLSCVQIFEITRLNYLHTD